MKSLEFYKSLEYDIIIKREELDGEKWYVAYHNSQLMMMLVRRGIAVIVGTVDRTFEKEIWYHNKYVTAQVPYKANVYKIVHDINWYKQTLLKAVADAIA